MTASEIKVSANTLLKFERASERGKVSCVSDLKKINATAPTDKKHTYMHGTAESRIVRYLTEPEKFKEHLVDKLESLRLELDAELASCGSKKSYKAIRLGANCDVIAAFIRFARKAPLILQYPMRRPKPRYARLSVGGISVSVRPQALGFMDENSLVPVSAVKVYLKKTEPLDKEGANVLGALVRRGIEMNYGVPDEVPISVWVIDVPRQKLYHFNGKYADYEARVEDVALEIFAMWYSAA